MGKVIPFCPPEPQKPESREEPHDSGLARCLSCHHEWQAVVPVKRDDLFFECPECGLLRGYFKWPFYPPGEGWYKVHWCGSELFLLDEDFRAFCPHCGEYVDFEE